jgi:ATP-dependent DNA helicase DinG
MSLSKWALIDIETTGVQPGEDEIIDIGYYQFEGTNLVKKYSSLVKSTLPISPFITKLTGITKEMCQRAPVLDHVLPELLELEGHDLLAHNAAFEKSFLERYFDKIAITDQPREKYIDSIPFLALLFPGQPSLGLESFLQQWNIADKEEHRGLSDARDLLKVLIIACLKIKKNKDHYFKMIQVLDSFPETFWWKDFFQLSEKDLYKIASQIDWEIRPEEIQDKKISYEEIIPAGKTSLESMTFNSQTITHFFQNEDEIQKTLPHYHFRKSQEEMALVVGKSFKNNVHALIQAPTGTGKTMGYLIPSVLFHLETKKQVLVTTGTKTLQEQIYTKDVPQIKKLLGESKTPVKFTRLIGSQNHLCELLFRHAQEEEPLLLKESEEKQYSEAYFEMLFYHNSQVSYDQMMTRENIPYVLKKTFNTIAELEQSYAVDYRACVGPRCPLAKNCSYMQGLKEAKESSVIIGNHSLMLNWPRSLDRPTHLVVDEAHRIEHEATSAFSLEITEQSLTNLLKVWPQGVGALFYLISQDSLQQEQVVYLRSESQQFIQSSQDQVRMLPQLMESLFKKSPRYQEKHMNELPMIKKNHDQDPLRVSLLHILESLNFIFSSFHGLLIPYFKQIQVNELKEDQQKMKAWAVFENMFSLLDNHVSVLKHLLDPPDLWCSTMNFQQDRGFAFVSSPIDVGALIHEKILVPAESVVFTSATLANAQGDSGARLVEWMTGYHYLKTARFKSGFYLPPVFDYKNKARVSLVTDLPAMNHPSFVVDLVDKTSSLIKTIEGRTLFLFSSRARFEMATNYLMLKFEGTLPLFVQGMGKNVVEDFKNSPCGILVGMESFGEGIDIPGEKLQLIIIDKVPDIRQDLVIEARRAYFEEKFGNEFQDYFLAHRARSLHQKFGRLLRRETDYGAVLVVDQRLGKWKGHTMKQFLKLMEPYDISVEKCDEALISLEKFLLEKH